MLEETGTKVTTGFVVIFSLMVFQLEIERAPLGLFGYAHGTRCRNVVQLSGIVYCTKNVSISLYLEMANTCSESTLANIAKIIF